MFFFVIKYFVCFLFFSLELHERVRQYCVFLLYTAKYFNVYDRQTQLLANENDMRCAFFSFLSVLNVIRTRLLIIKALIETTRQIIE